MQTFTYIIRDKEGVHARPAGIVVAEAKKYASDMTISAHGSTVDLKRIFAVMGLCIKCGEEVAVNITGSDEEAALDAVRRAFIVNL